MSRVHIEAFAAKDTSARQGRAEEDASKRSEASHANGASRRKRLARERVGEPEGRSPSE